MLTFVLANLGKIAGLSGDYAEARRLLQESIAFAKKFGSRSGLADAQNYLGHVDLRSKAYEEAKLTFLENLAFEKDQSYGKGEVDSLIGLGEATHHLGDYTGAMQYFIDALKVAMNFHLIPRALDALTGIAELLIQMQAQEQAVPLLALVRHHRATDHETKTRAQSLFARLETKLSSQVVAAAVEQAKTRPLATIVQAFLDNQLSMKPISSETERPAPDLLTERELEILRLIVTGLNSREVAQRLYLSVGTIRWYLKQLYGKLNAHSRAQALAHARELNLLN